MVNRIYLYSRGNEMTAYEQIERRIENIHNAIQRLADKNKFDSAGMWAWHLLALNEKKQAMTVEEAWRMVE
jgi:hypothetical protein